MAGVFAVITGLVKFFVANKVATITTGIVFGLVLLTVGLYHYLHHRYPRNYTTLRSIHQSSKKNSYYYSFKTAASAQSFCDSQEGCKYIIQQGDLYYIASDNGIKMCETVSPSTGAWCSIDNSTNIQKSMCYNQSTGAVHDCVGSGCQYSDCEKFYNRVHTCNACLTSPTPKQFCASTGECIESASGAMCPEKPVVSCNQLLGKYGDIPYVSDSSTVLYSNSPSCNGESSINGYKMCSPTMFIQTSPLFTNSGIEEKCSKDTNCIGYICDEDQCTYVNRGSSLSCCQSNALTPYCQHVTFECKGNCPQFPSNCLSA